MKQSVVGVGVGVGVTRLSRGCWSPDLTRQSPRQITRASVEGFVVGARYCVVMAFRTRCRNDTSMTGFGSGLDCWLIVARNGNIRARVSL